MILVAFVAFFVLVLSWLLAPNGDPRPHEAPAARLGENAAARAATGAAHS